jgi:hypothetical protein
MFGADIGVLPAPGFITGRLKDMAALFAKPRVHGFAPRQPLTPEGGKSGPLASAARGVPELERPF